MTTALPYRIEKPHRSHACISDMFSQHTGCIVAGIYLLNGELEERRGGGR